MNLYLPPQKPTKTRQRANIIMSHLMMSIVSGIGLMLAAALAVLDFQELGYEVNLTVLSRVAFVLLVLPPIAWCCHHGREFLTPLFWSELD